MPDPDERYTLSVAGDAEGGVDIHSRSTLAAVREGFPVPQQFFFGVPLAREGGVLAKDFMPLTLLNGAEVPNAKLEPRPSDATRLKRELREKEEECAIERERRQAAEDARDTAMMKERALTKELEAARITIQRLGTRHGGSGSDDATRRLFAAPAELRQEMVTLRAMAVQAKAEAAATTSGLASALLEQLEVRLQAARAQHEQQQRATLAARDKSAVELERLRLQHDALSDGLAAVSSACKEKDAQIAALREEVQDVYARLAAPRAAPPPPSAFADYMKLSHLKRDCEQVLHAGHELHRCPTSDAALGALASTIRRLGASSTSIMDGAIEAPPGQPPPAAALVVAAPAVGPADRSLRAALGGLDPLVDPRIARSKSHATLSPVSRKPRGANGGLSLPYKNPIQIAARAAQPSSTSSEVPAGSVSQAGRGLGAGRSSSSS